jgi:hypothetical protein
MTTKKTENRVKDWADALSFTLFSGNNAILGFLSGFTAQTSQNRHQ